VLREEDRGADAANPLRWPFTAPSFASATRAPGDAISEDKAAAGPHHYPTAPAGMQQLRAWSRAIQGRRAALGHINVPSRAAARPIYRRRGRTAR
jgi:hypothetical protein